LNTSKEGNSTTFLDSLLNPITMITPERGKKRDLSRKMKRCSIKEKGGRRGFQGLT